MKNVPRLVLTAAAGVLLGSILVAADATGRTPQQATPPAAQPTPAPEPAAEDPAVPLMVQMCNRCHDAARILATRRTRTEWEDIINKMIERGATGSGREFETVFSYLLLNYGKIFVNDAVADEFMKVLGMSRKDADAIVAYRTANGAFADVEALRKVPGIDLKTLDAHLQAVAFQ